MPILTTGVGKYAGGAAYAGPGDIVTSGALHFWGLRAFSLAKATAAVNCIDISDNLGNNVATLGVQANGDLNVTVIKSGSMAGSSVADWIVANGTPYVPRIYDQVGSLTATGTNARGQLFGQNVFGTKPSVQFTAANSGVRYLTTAITQAQPFSFSTVARRTAAVNYDGLLGSGGPSLKLGFWGVADRMEFNLGSSSSTVGGATEGIAHAIQWICNGAASICNIDGTDTNPVTPDPGSATITAETLGIGDRGGGGFDGGDIGEIGMWTGTTSSVNYLALRLNQKSYWGTP